MIMPAYIPPLWFAIMNKRVRAHYDNNMSKINMHPKPLSPLIQRTTDIFEKGLQRLNRIMSEPANR